jgi:hypothetical protein
MALQPMIHLKVLQIEEAHLFSLAFFRLLPLGFRVRPCAMLLVLVLLVLLVLLLLVLLLLLLLLLLLDCAEQARACGCAVEEGKQQVHGVKEEERLGPWDVAAMNLVVQLRHILKPMN